MKLASIKKRNDFVLISKAGKKAFAKGLLLQAYKTGSSDNEIKVGYTASKKVGNAVCRNKAKRRLRAVTQEIIPFFAKKNYSYVIIGKKATLERNFEDLKKDLKYTLHSTDTHK